MKLSEYQGEAALDILADLIEPAGEIMADKQIGDVFLLTTSIRKRVSVADKFKRFVNKLKKIFNI